ncbi:gastrin/cholecystokinin type B receptor-like [Lytechinus pictus]|uniref:gastrin/cholecystokinin type B receptor-like n=1 Tax=Lytechinus pictus TaxID=7653 RepID=UPI0030B9F63E
MTWKTVMITNIQLQSEDPFIYRDHDGERGDFDRAVDVARIFQLILGSIGCVGNFLCFVVLLRKSLRSYTNFLIVTQTVADFIASAFLILVTSLRLLGYGSRSRQIDSEPFGIFYCHFLYSHLPIFALFSISTYNLTVISIERYLAVMKPMWYIAKFKRRWLYILTAVAWILAPSMQIIISIDVEYVDGVCQTADNFSSIYVGMAIFVWEYFLPATVMIVSFACVANKLRRLNRISVTWFREHDHDTVRVVETTDDSSTTQSRKTKSRPAKQFLSKRTEPSHPNPDIPTSSSSPPPSTKRPVVNDHRPPSMPRVVRPAIIRRRKTTKILLVIVMVYMICWSPNQWAFFYHNIGGHFLIDGKLHLATIILATCNTCINPFILAFRYKVYQRGLMDLVRRFFNH